MRAKHSRDVHNLCDVKIVQETGQADIIVKNTFEEEVSKACEQDRQPAHPPKKMFE